MSTEYVVPWNPPPAEDATALMDVLFTAASALKTQTEASAYLASPQHSALRSKIDELADAVHGLQGDVDLRT
ncbi:hypothetical protein [Achromobacter animicus]|uniref:hypothetical protein n=1 Tax=Achromobacter animicus TaxID=1389935 RepID=UPI0028A9A231|nr:hypothetical protein [Achromobacter animicus]